MAFGPVGKIRRNIMTNIKRNNKTIKPTKLISTKHGYKVKISK